MALEARKVTCYRGQNLLFQDLSFCLNAGEALHLVGQNGSGKTTLLEIMAGSFLCETGSFYFQDTELKSDQAIFIGVQKGFKSALTITENLIFWCQVYEADSKNIVKALSYFGLTAFESTFYSDLSTGQKQRLSLARLLLVSRPLWLLDEPFLGLDQKNGEKLKNLCRQHLEKGGLLCVASHGKLGIKAQNLNLRDFYTPNTFGYYEA